MVYRKHQSDIRQRRSSCGRCSPCFSPESSSRASRSRGIPPTNLTARWTTRYPVPYAKRQRAIDFLQPDNRVVLPVAHIKGVTGENGGAV